MSYRIYTGINGMELWESTIAHQFRPTEETKKRLDNIVNKINSEAIDRSEAIQDYFKNTYGEATASILCKMNKYKYFTGHIIKRALKNYMAKKLEEDDYIEIVFDRGRFDVNHVLAGGYGGSIIVEPDITLDRAELLIDNYGE